MNTVGARIDKIRKVKGMTLEEFGVYLGFGKGKSPARQVISRMVNNHRKPSFENLQQLKSDGVDLNWLLSGNGEVFDASQNNSSNNEITFHFYILSCTRENLLVLVH